MEQKTKDIIFYVLAGLFGAGAITCAVFEAIGGLPAWLAGLLAALGIIFAVAGTFLVAKNLNNRDARKIEADKKEAIEVINKDEK